MTECYLLQIWRRVGIDLVKIWLVYKEKGQDISNLSTNTDKMLDYVLKELIPELNKKLYEEMAKNFGSEFLDDIDNLQKNFAMEGNYDSNLEPIIAYQYLWWEIFAGIIPELPDSIQQIVANDKKYLSTGEFGNLLQKGLITIEHDLYPIKMVFGIRIVKKTDFEC